jgi:hypothetical protein
MATELIGEEPNLQTVFVFVHEHQRVSMKYVVAAVIDFARHEIPLHHLPPQVAMGGLLSFEDLSVRDLSMEEAQEWQFGFYVPPPPPPARLGAGRRAAARLSRRRPAHRRA